MKFVVSILPSLVFATKEAVINQKIIDLVQSAKQEALNSIPVDSPARIQSRNLDTESYLTKVANYGCWCTKAYNGDGHRGKPIDNLDTICRSWVRARNCEKLAVCDGEVDLDYEKFYKSSV